MFQAQNREIKNSTWKVAVSFNFQDHYDDECDKTVRVSQHDQDNSVQDQDHFLGLRPVLSLYLYDDGLVKQCSL